MKRLVRRLALALVACCAFGTAQAQVVISQVYGGAQNSGAVYKSDFVELHNNGSTSQDLAGWSLQYGSSTGTGFSGSMALSGTIPAGGYFLIQLSSTTTGNALPTPDATGSLSLAGTAGKVVLVRNTALLTSCPTANPNVADLVGYGSGTTCFEGSAPTPAPAGPTAVFRAGAGCTDTQQNGADFSVATPAPRNSATPALMCDGSGTPTLSISDTSVTEGNFSSTIALFTVSLNQPAGAGGVSFDFATADGTATAGVDYIAPTPATVLIAEGATSVTLGVTVNGDGDEEANETFFLNVTNVVGATVGDGQGTGTISNDDVTLTPIHAIQGNGATSPLVGTSVSTAGIVTGRKSNGFFIQTGDGEDDGDDATSEGVFVFTSTAPPAAAAVGNVVLVTATVAEYVPAADPYQLPMTELTSPTVLQISTGHPLPTAVVLTTSMPSPAGGLDQLERYEGMRVTADSFTVAAPTQGSTSESSATGTSNGLLHVVVTGTARPVREPGIQVPDPDPAGTSATAIPRWDFNPELLTVDSDAIGGAQLNVAAGTTLANLVGPLDYGFRRYTILAQAGIVVAVGAQPQPTAARLPTADEFTVAGYNLERFFDTANDPAIGEPVLSEAAFDKRLGKASIAIRDYLHSPDIVAVVEVENLSTLQQLADRINADAVAAAEPSYPGYVPYLIEGNDVGGIDVGFLVKTVQGAGLERVHVINVTQYGKNETWLDPSDNTQHLLNDRPPLLLTADVHFADGRVFPVNVLVVHQRSLNGVDSEEADGATTEGDRVRRKRQAQAEYLAGVVQSLQAVATDHLVVLGDFNAFEFNDGYVDAMGVVMGTPSADALTAVNGDGADLVDPDLVNLAALEDAEQRYSFVFEGNAQSLDHVLVNERLAADAGSIDLDHARINADFPETARNDGASPARLADHDPAIAYISVASADLAVDIEAPASAQVSSPLTFHATLTNLGPHDASYPGLGFSLNAEIGGLQVDAPDGWTCDVPQAGYGTTTFACAAASIANGETIEVSLSAPAPASSAYGSLTLVASADSQTVDPLQANNSASASVAVLANADLGTAFGLVGSSTSGNTYGLSIANAGPNEARVVHLAFDSNLPLSSVTFTPPAGWTCSLSGSGRVSGYCDIDEGITLASGATATFQFVVPKRLVKTSYYIHAEVGCEADGNTANNKLSQRLGMPQP
jgi:hypothetical protein